MWNVRAGRLLWWLGPILFLLWIDQYGLKTWFMQDDFAWLGLLRKVHESRSLLNALFAPEAQGTIRPWSERGFFLLFESLFGFDSPPWRICVFLTMAANVALVAWLTRRITGSRLAGFIAPILWVGNTALSTVLSWNSAYNEALCALFILGSLALFIRFDETGKRSWWWWQVVVFTLGFGALEVNVVYPALAAAYAVFLSRSNTRRLLLSLIPLFGLSIVYFFVHRAVAPLPTDGPYAIHFDHRILETLGTYWQWTLTPYNFWPGNIRLQRRTYLWLVSIVLAIFCARELNRRKWLVLFCAAWFLITLSPMLPIPDHPTDYYLTLPLIGFSMAAAWGAVCAWRAGWPRRLLAVLMVAAFLRIMITVSISNGHWWVNHSSQVRALVLGAAAAHRTHPDETIVIDGVTTDLYEDAFAQMGFYPLGLDYVYLTPGSEDNIHPTDDPEYLRKLVLEPSVMYRAVTHDQVVVYSLFGDHLRNITDSYARSVSARFPLAVKSGELPDWIEVGNPLVAYALGPEWFGLESGVRWMPQRATVRLAVPESSGQQRHLIVDGVCPAQFSKDGPLHLSVTIDRQPLESAEICKPDAHFRRLYVLNQLAAGSDSVEIGLSVDRVLQEPGGRKLGLVFGTIGFVK